MSESNAASKLVNQEIKLPEDVKKATVTSLGKSGAILSIVFNTILLTIWLVFLIYGLAVYVSEWSEFVNSAEWNEIEADPNSVFYDFWKYYLNTWLAVHLDGSIFYKLGPILFIVFAILYLAVYLPLATTSIVFCAQYMHGNGYRFKMTAAFLSLYSNLIGGILIFSARPKPNYKEDLPKWISANSPDKRIEQVLTTISKNDEQILELKAAIIVLKDDRSKLKDKIINNKMQIATLKQTNSTYRDYLSNQELNYKTLVAEYDAKKLEQSNSKAVSSKPKTTNKKTTNKNDSQK